MRARTFIQVSLHCGVSLNNLFHCPAIIRNITQLPCKFLHRVNGCRVIIQAFSPFNFCGCIFVEIEDSVIVSNLFISKRCLTYRLSQRSISSRKHEICHVITVK